MSQRSVLSQLLRSLAIQGGSHWVNLRFDEESWRFPVADGRVGPLQGAGKPEEELPMLAALGASLEISSEPGSTPNPDARWPLAARLARTLDDQEAQAQAATSKVEDGLPPLGVTVVQQLDGLLGFAESLEVVTTEDELVDSTIAYISSIRPGAALLNRIDETTWIGPRGRIDGRVDVIEEAASKGLMGLRRAIGEGYEGQLPDQRADRIALLPLGPELVILVPCHGPHLEERPRDLRVLLSLYRSAHRWLVRP